MGDASQPMRRVMVALGIAAPVFFLSALILFAPLRQNTPALVHMILAAGVMPLIMGAMIYFTPVLTHTRAPSWPILLLPGLSVLAGIWATASLFWRRDLVMLPALTAMLVAGVLLGWIWHRARNMVGRPHPGLHWYRLALVGLILGLFAISMSTLWLESWTAFRQFHLHMNIFGFVGLTAVGTLRVLLPTVAGYNDPVTGVRLQRDLYPMALGALLMAAGSAGWCWLVWPGLAFWLVPLARFAFSLVSHWREQVWGWHRPGMSLGLAVAGLMLVLIAKGFHAAGVLPGEAALPLFVYMFLFPLVTGAISYLLPVWVWPARNDTAYEAAVHRLAWGSGVRALVFFAAGILTLSGQPGAAYLAGAAMAIFLVQLIWALSARLFKRL